MAEGRSRQLWDHTSCVMALMANLQRSKKSDRMWRPEDFHPYAKKADQAIDAATPDGLGRLRQAFCPIGTKVTVLKAAKATPDGEHA